MTAWACRTTKNNTQVIASEHPKFNAEEFQTWLEDHDEDGYFVRDESSAFDCKYMSEFVFLRIYAFERSDESSLFRVIHQI